MQKCWCGNKELKEYSAEYNKCDKCRTLISKHSFPDTICDVNNEEEDLYGKNYWEVSMMKVTGKSTLSEVVDMYLTERVIHWIKYILKYVKFESDIAETGCGLGSLQYLLKRMGYRQTAFELSAGICDYMEKELYINTHCGPFTENPNAYDGILAFDLFEHLPEPVAFIDHCAKSIRESGIICLQTPCYDPNLSYQEMMVKKSRFQEQLRAEQHIFIFSKESVTKVLAEQGFKNIVFEPAFFGYDMFLFASKQPFQINTEKKIDDYLNATVNGRLVKAIITLFDRGCETAAKQLMVEKDGVLRLEQVNELTGLLQASEADRAARLEQVNELTGLLQASEADRAARLEQINKIPGIIRKIFC